MTHLQRGRTLQDTYTTLDSTAVLARAASFFAEQSGVYAAFVEQQSPTHLVLRGQGGEEIAIGVLREGEVTRVSGSSYLFDAQVARFLASLPPAERPVPTTAEVDA
jgi:hypothetical protein